MPGGRIHWCIGGQAASPNTMHGRDALHFSVLALYTVLYVAKIRAAEARPGFHMLPVGAERPTNTCPLVPLLCSPNFTCHASRG